MSMTRKDVRRECGSLLFLDHFLRPLLKITSPKCIDGVATGANLFSDDDDNNNGFWSNGIKAKSELSFQIPKETFSLSPSISTLSSSLTSSPGLSESTFTSQHSLNPNIAKDIYINASQHDILDGFETFVTDFQPKESGYGSSPLVRSPSFKKMVPYKEPKDYDIGGFEKKLAEYDLQLEADKFVKDPDSSELFRPNVDYYEAKLVKDKVMLDLKNFIRQNLEAEVIKSQNINSGCIKISDNKFNISNNFAGKSRTQGTIERSYSPDLFEIEDEKDEVLSGKDIVITPFQPGALSPDILKTSYDDLYSINQSYIGEIISNTEQHTKKPASERTYSLANKIQSIIQNFLEKIVNDEPIEFVIRNSNIISNCYLDYNEVLTLKPSSECSHKRVSASNAKSRFRFQMIMFLLTEIHHFLLSGTSCTSRELYYKDPEFVKDPVNIHLGMKDICNLLEAAPWELGVFSSSKGLIAGCLVMSLASGENVNCSLHSGGILLPHNTTGVKSLHSTAKYALLVEKDTVYEKLLKQNIFEKLGPDVILITGKGFPDVNTRVIVKKISSELSIPIYGLFDADPFGIEIFFVYRHGSRGMSFNADKLACPQLKWIGVHPSEIELLGVPSLALNEEDKKRLKHLLQRPYITNEVRNELLVLQRGNRKAEIEGISSFSENYLLAEYIPNKIRRDFVI